MEKKEKRMYCNHDIFSAVKAKLQKDGRYPEIIDYATPADKVLYIKNDAWQVVGEVCFGGNEGIYLDVYAVGYVTQETERERIRLGVFKTLLESREAHYLMSRLATDFAFETRDFMIQHEKDFEWTGVKVTMYKDNEAKRIIHRCENGLSTGVSYYWSEGYDAVEIENLGTGKTVKLSKGESFNGFDDKKH